MRINYEDSEILLVVKPAGVATQSRRIGEKDMLSMAKTYRVERGEPDYIGMVHRLDQPVGGLLLFAKTKEAAASLSRQMRDGTAEKYYQALLCGNIEKEGALADYLLKDGKTNVSRVVEAGTPGAKRAELHFVKKKDFGEISLVEIRLDTGRHHQIRVQMAHHGFPLLGDRKYNPEARAERCPGLALFAWKLKFRHPKTKERMEFAEEPDFGAFLRSPDGLPERGLSPDGE